MNWHKLFFCCPKCSKQATVVSVSFDAEANVLLEGACVVCGLTLSFETSFAKQVSYCYIADKNEFGLLQPCARGIQ